MKDVLPQRINPPISDRNVVKRHLARKMIQQIITLYDTIIEKIEHGIGILWEEYISQELYTIAKRRVQSDLIKDFDELQTWFEKISFTIRQEFNSLSDNLKSHFDKIIDEEVKSIDEEIDLANKFTIEQELTRKLLEEGEYCEQRKENSSLYETCTQSSRQDRKKSKNYNKSTDYLEKNQGSPHIINKSQTSNQKQFNSHVNSVKILDLPSKIHQSSQQSEKIENRDISFQKYNIKQIRQQQKKKQQERDSQEAEEFFEGSFYGVFFGLLEAFEI